MSAHPGNPPSDATEPPPSRGTIYPPRLATGAFDAGVPNPAGLRLPARRQGPPPRRPRRRRGAARPGPEARAGRRENRAFLGVPCATSPPRASGGSSTSGPACPPRANVHEVAQAVAPDARVVYVDNDPVVHVHANALLAAPTTAAVLGDPRQPDVITRDPGRGSCSTWPAAGGALIAT